MKTALLAITLLSIANAQTTIDEAELQMKLDQAATRLGKSNACPSADELEKGLSFSQCKVSAPSKATRETTLAELYNQRLNSVLWIGTTEPCDDCPMWHFSGVASAFVVGDNGECATCHHVFEDMKRGAFLLAAASDGKVYPIKEVLAASRKDDIAIFKIDAVGLKPVPLALNIAAGENIAALTHPHGRPFFLSSGIVSRRAIMEDRRSKREMLQVTSPFAIGSSGGLIMDMKGNAVGMAASTISVYAEPQRRREPQMTYYNCVPAEAILKLMGR